jgi:response regulator NasT
MVFNERTYSVLVVSASDKGTEMIVSLLPTGTFFPITIVDSICEAKRLLIDHSYEIIIINSPLPDDCGTEFAQDISSGSSAGVLLIVRSEQYDEIAAGLCSYGVLVLSKPTSRQSVFQAIRLLCATREKIRKYEKITDTLDSKMEEIRLVNRAKWTLIEYLKMSESEAHRYIEKQAMDMRITKRAAAENILRMYEN